MSKTHLIAAIVFLLSVGTAATAEAPDDSSILRSIIADIKSGWENGDPIPFEKHFLEFDGARYIETGGQNVGLRDLIDHHVVPEKDALQGLTLTFENIDIHFEHEFAWAIADVHVQATVVSDGRKIDKKGYETFLFRKVSGAWKVVHTHSSTRSRK